jgi:hypothetical protein
MSEDLRDPGALEERLAEDEARLAADEARLSRDEARLSHDEARLEAEEAEVKENRIVAWFGVGLALALVVAVTALVLGLVAVQGDVGSIRRTAGDGSVDTSALQDDAVTAAKLAAGAVTADAMAGGAIGSAALAPRAVTGAHVARDTLTGADIRERSLRAVPSAREAGTAETAANAKQLGGLPARVYLSQVTNVRAATVTDARRVKGPLTARCPAGTRVIAGGAGIRGAVTGGALVRNEPEDGSGWTATARLASAQRAWQLVVTAICAAGGE